MSGTGFGEFAAILLSTCKSGHRESLVLERQ
jgi:hypothetical protein